MGIHQFALTRKALYNKNLRRGTHGSGEDYVCIGIHPPNLTLWVVTERFSTLGYQNHQAVDSETNWRPTYIAYPSHCIHKKKLPASRWRANDDSAYPPLRKPIIEHNI